jgi:DNA-binding NarL/FixJ family response regulator
LNEAAGDEALRRLQGCRNRGIGLRLGTTEQVIKNRLRNIYDKTGVSDRVESALFTTHHRLLMLRPMPVTRL